MPVRLEASEQRLKRVFSDDYLFSIPSYQRPYAWSKEQASELYDDILNAMEEAPNDLYEATPYFLGSIVLIKSLDAAAAQVVDGQQRLTTLTLLIACIRDMMTDEEEQKDLHYFIGQVGSKFKGTQDQYRVTLRPRDAKFFQDNFQRLNSTLNVDELSNYLSDPRSNLKNNAQLFRERLKEINSEKLTRLASFLVICCSLVLVSTEDQESAFRIFSVMNDRGLDLSATDILKAEIIGTIPEHKQDAYTNVWEDIEEELGRDSFTDLFRHIRMIHQQDKSRRLLTREFRDYVMTRFHLSESQIDAESLIDNEILPLAELFKMIIGSQYVGNEHVDEINRYLIYLNRLDNSDWIPPALQFIRHHSDEPSTIVNFLRKLDRLAYGMFLMRTYATPRINRYAQVLKSIAKGTPPDDSESPLQLSPYEKNQALSVLSGPIYNIQRIRLPILMRLDELISAGGATYNHRVITVEHVLPQSPAEGSKWLEWFPDPDVREEWLHRLGNLALLPRAKNSQASNYEFTDKKYQYFVRNGVTTFALTNQVLNKEEWTPEIVEERQEDLVGKLAELWELY